MSERESGAQSQPENEITLNGETLVPLTGAALYWPRLQALIVADLHFEKGSSFARQGVPLPGYDTRSTLRRLGQLCSAYKPATIISLGDAFHDLGAEGRMDDADIALLDALISGHEWLWILGNHDPEPPKRFGGTVARTERIGGLFMTHEPNEHAEPGEIAGHMHPCARVRTGNKTLRRRCFVQSPERLIMPAFGAFTGGLNVLDEAFGAYLPGEFTAWAIGGEGVYPIPRRGLARDSLPLRPIRA
ncbi:MAG: ligase-associated DNA damage response endonuclease PdeM [Pseudomonadota bacterium]